MKCTNCGNEVPETANVCGYCGHRLKSTPAPAAPPAVAQPAAAYVPPMNVQPVIAARPRYAAAPSAQGAWGFPQWIAGALLWGIAAIVVDFVMAALSFYVFYPEMQNRWSGLWSYIQGTGYVSWASAIFWAIPGALAGGTRKTALQMLLGFAIFVPLGVILGTISPRRDLDFNAITGLRTGLQIAPLAAALFIVWLGAAGASRPGFATIFHWILLVLCGISFALLFFYLIISAFERSYPYLLSIGAPIVGIILAVVVGLRGKANR